MIFEIRAANIPKDKDFSPGVTHFSSRAINSYGVYAAGVSPAAVKGFHFVFLHIPLPQQDILVHRSTE